jgi:hypothetical protein
MRRILVTGVLLLAGCRSNVIGPFEHRRPERVDDPTLTIPEQQRRGRDRLALPDDSSTTGPPSGVERPTRTNGLNPSIQ